MFIKDLKELKALAKAFSAKKLHYYRWNSSEPYTIWTCNEKGEVKTLGYLETSADIINMATKISLPVYAECPFN
jgi:hypothetical protein